MRTATSSSSGWRTRSTPSSSRSTRAARAGATAPGSAHSTCTTAIFRSRARPRRSQRWPGPIRRWMAPGSGSTAGRTAATSRRWRSCAGRTCSRSLCALAGRRPARLRRGHGVVLRPCRPPSWDEASLLTWAARPPTSAQPARPLVLVHGTADDNVYVAHALKLAAAMGMAGRPVEFVPLVGQTHIVGGLDHAAVMSRRVAPHFRAHLNGPPCASAHEQGGQPPH
jgi:Prolyl oligopeptidase family